MAVLSPSALPRPRVLPGPPRRFRPSPLDEKSTSVAGGAAGTPVTPGSPGVPGTALPPLTLTPGVLVVLLGMVTAFLATLAVSAVTGAPQATAARTTLSAGPPESAAYPAWTVQPGDSLWSIARQVAPQADPRAVVLELQVLNEVAPGHTLHPGEVLRLPPAGD